MVKIGDTVNGFTIEAVAAVADHVAILGKREGTRGDVTEVEYVTATMLPDGSWWHAGNYFGPARTFAGDSRNRAEARADFCSRAGWGIPDNTDDAPVKVYMHGEYGR